MQASLYEDWKKTATYSGASKVLPHFQTQYNQAEETGKTLADSMGAALTKKVENTLLQTAKNQFVLDKTLSEPRKRQILNSNNN